MYITIAIFVVGVLLANFAGRFGDSVADVYPRLIPKYDLYLNHINYINKRLWFMPDLTVGLLYLVALALCLFNFISIDYEQFIYELGSLYIIRAVACCLTVGYVSPRRIITTGAIKGGGNCYCSDLVISGHTITASMLYYFVCDELSNGRNSTNWFSKELHNSGTICICYTVLWIISVSSNLFVGDHYSSDIFIGLVLAYFYHY